MVMRRKSQMPLSRIPSGTLKILSTLFSVSPSRSLYLSPKTLNPHFHFFLLRSKELHTQNPYYFATSTRSHSNCTIPRPFSQSCDPLSQRFSFNYKYPVSVFPQFRPYFLYRLFSSCSQHEFSDKNSGFGDMGITRFNESIPSKRNIAGQELKENVTVNQISEVIHAIRSGKNDLDERLSVLGSDLSVKSIREIFRVLNYEKVNALQFFQLACKANPLRLNDPDVCCLIIANCGSLDDYGTMVSLLKEFSLKRICLNEMAFEFLPVLGSSKDSTMQSISKVVGVLNEAGGSCLGSGICALIRMLCSLDFFEMARFVIETTERRLSYFNILVLERCKRCHFEEARLLLKEMRELGCHPNVNSYNYLISTLCKSGKSTEANSMLEEMQEMGIHADATTFEILIYYSSRIGKLDAAKEFLNCMLSRGLEPRLTTHAAFIKGSFFAAKYEEAYTYVREMGVRCTSSSCNVYSLLASLHHSKGDPIVAGNILIEMMEKGLKPDFRVYMRIVKQLIKTGRGGLAADLRRKFSRFSIESNTATG